MDTSSLIKLFFAGEIINHFYKRALEIIKGGPRITHGEGKRLRYEVPHIRCPSLKAL